MMNGIIKTTDNLGRIVLPKPIRKRMGITQETKLEITEENGKLVITVVTVACKLCGTTKDVDTVMGLCLECINRIKAI